MLKTQIDIALGKIKQLKHLALDADVAALLGMSSSNFSNKKNRGTLLPDILEYASREGLDLAWLLCDEADPRPAHTDARLSRLVAQVGQGPVPVMLTRQEALWCCMLRELSEAERAMIGDTITEAYLAKKWAPNRREGINPDDTEE